MSKNIGLYHIQTEKGFKRCLSDNNNDNKWGRGLYYRMIHRDW